MGATGFDSVVDDEDFSAVGAEVRLADLRKFKGATGKLSRSLAEEREGGSLSGSSCDDRDSFDSSVVPRIGVSLSLSMKDDSRSRLMGKRSRIKLCTIRSIFNSSYGNDLIINTLFNSQNALKKPSLTYVAKADTLKVTEIIVGKDNVR